MCIRDRPYIAAFDKRTGDKKYLTTVSIQKKEFIEDINQEGKNLLFVYKDHVSKYDITEGRQLVDQAFDVKEYGEMKHFISSRVFVQKDSVFTSLLQVDTSKQYLYTESGTVLVLNEKLEIEAVSYTHLPSPRDKRQSRMPSSA